MDHIRIDRLNILRRNPAAAASDDQDLERQQHPAGAAPSTVSSSPASSTTATPRPEMAQRVYPSGGGFLPRFSAFRPTIPSFLSTGSRRSSTLDAPPPPRPFRRSANLYPSSSLYSDDDDDYRRSHGLDPEPEEVVDSPKTPRFSLNMLNLPSTRLHLPHLARTWTQGSSGPPSRPDTAQGVGGGAEGDEYLHPLARGARERERERGRYPDIAMPMPTAAPDYVQWTGQHQQQARTRYMGADADETDLAQLVDDSRRRRGGERDRRHRHHHHHHHHREGRRGERGRHGRGETRRRAKKPPPEHFLFCFPWVPSRRKRSLILRCFVSGLFLIMMLAIYLALSITKTISTSEFTVLLILIILFATIFFCHSLIRLCVLIVRASRDDERGARGQAPQGMGPGGYAVPREPIRVVLARDEEAAGVESEATKTGPPAYGLWRESVRVDPNRIFWQRSEQQAVAAEGGPRPATSERRASSPRPPSYASDDGVSYVVEAQPRSIAPTADVPLPVHPSEAGRVALRPAH